MFNRAPSVQSLDTFRLKLVNAKTSQHYSANFVVV